MSSADLMGQIRESLSDLAHGPAETLTKDQAQKLLGT